MIRRLRCWWGGHRMCVYAAQSQVWFCRCLRRSETDKQFLHSLFVKGWKP